MFKNCLKLYPIYSEDFRQFFSKTNPQGWFVFLMFCVSVFQYCFVSIQMLCTIRAYLASCSDPEGRDQSKKGWHWHPKDSSDPRTFHCYSFHRSPGPPSSSSCIYFFYFGTIFSPATEKKHFSKIHTEHSKDLPESSLTQFLSPACLSTSVESKFSK